jgi:hypothetical protein
MGGFQTKSISEVLGGDWLNISDSIRYTWGGGFHTKSLRRYMERVD